MSAFATALAAIHADPNMSTDAEYQAPGGGAWVPVRIVRSSPADRLAAAGALGARAVAREAWVRTADLVPARGGKLRIGADTFRIEVAEPDDLGLSYRCDLAT